MPENAGENRTPSWLKLIAQAGSYAPGLWLKGQRQEDWMRGAGAFWGGVSRAEERRRQNEQREALTEYYKERAKTLESERKAEEAKAKLESQLKTYRAGKPLGIGQTGVGQIGTPSMIGQTQIGGDVTLSPERLNWIRSQMGGGARPAPPTGQRLKPSPPAGVGEMRPELFEPGTPMTGQERGQFLGAVGTTAGGMVRPDLFGKSPTPKEKTWIDSSGRLVQKTATDYGQAMSAGEVLTDNVKGYTQAVNAYYNFLVESEPSKIRAEAKKLGYKDTKALNARLATAGFLRELAVQKAIEDYTDIDFSKYEK